MILIKRWQCRHHHQALFHFLCFSSCLAPFTVESLAILHSSSAIYFLVDDASFLYFSTAFLPLKKCRTHFLTPYIVNTFSHTYGTKHDLGYFWLLKYNPVTIKLKRQLHPWVPWSSLKAVSGCPEGLWAKASLGVMFCFRLTGYQVSRGDTKQTLPPLEWYKWNLT